VGFSIGLSKTTVKASYVLECISVSHSSRLKACRTKVKAMVANELIKYLVLQIHELLDPMRFGYH
jgi:hypothetical protein